MLKSLINLLVLAAGSFTKNYRLYNDMFQAIEALIWINSNSWSFWNCLLCTLDKII